MTIELKPLGVKCNLRCAYCYQNPQRDASNIVKPYDLQKMKSAVEKEGGPFSLFGGEPLLLPLEDLEDLWSWGFQRWGRNSVQTNGTLISETHISLFKRYNVYVGISIDGPAELNDLRIIGSATSTREATARTEYAIKRMCQEGIPPGLIVTLHKINATRDKLPLMHRWIKYLESIGVKFVRLHLLESENQNIRTSFSLTIEENVNALLNFLKWEQELNSLKFDMFDNMRRLLNGNDSKVACVWGACDPYTTHAVQGIEGNGQRTNCDRTNKDGIDYVKSDIAGYERYLALYNTPQEYGGCKDCRFFLMCKGQCPGTAIDGDWRNRTEYCEVWKTLYQRLEHKMIRDGLNPLSADTVLRKRMEGAFINRWTHGGNTMMVRHQELKQRNAINNDSQY